MASVSTTRAELCGKERKLTAKELLLSRSDDGEMDWKTLGNIITASTLGEALCGSYADFKYGRMNREFRADIEWKFAYEEKDVLVFKRSTEKSAMCFMGRGLIDRPLKEVAAFISSIEDCHLWNRFLVEAKVLQTLAETPSHKSFLVYFLHENKRCFGKTRRDFLMFVNSTYIDGKFVQSAISVEHPLCPPVKNVVRAECCLGSGWVLEPYEGSETRTLATYIANVNLSIPLPSLMLNKVLSRQPLTVFYVREQLMRRQSISPQHEPAYFRPSERTTAERAISDERGNVSSSLEDSDQYVSSFFFIGYNASLKQYEEPMAVSDFMYHRRLSHSKPPKRPPATVPTVLARESTGDERGKSSEDSEAEIDTRTLLHDLDDDDHYSGSPPSQHNDVNGRTKCRVSSPTKSHQQQQQQQFQTVM